MQVHQETSIKYVNALDIPCTIGILTLNSEKTLERCLSSLNGFREILILDGNSTDRTQEIARRFGARIEIQEGATELNHRIKDFALVRNQLLECSTQPWYFDIDSDEYMSNELRERIRMIVGDVSICKTAYNILNIPMVNGRPVTHSFMRPSYYVRLHKRSDGLRFHPKKVLHEKLLIPEDVHVLYLKEPVYSPWGTPEEQMRKDEQYLSIVREKYRQRTGDRRIGAILRSILRNGALAARVVFRTGYIAMRYPANERLPWAYARRYMWYYLRIVWIRFEQIIR